MRHYGWRRRKGRPVGVSLVLFAGRNSSAEPYTLPPSQTPILFLRLLLPVCQHFLLHHPFLVRTCCCIGPFHHRHHHFSCILLFRLLLALHWCCYSGWSSFRRRRCRWAAASGASLSVTRKAYRMVFWDRIGHLYIDDGLDHIIVTITKSSHAQFDSSFAYATFSFFTARPHMAAPPFSR